MSKAWACWTTGNAAERPDEVSPPSHNLDRSQVTHNNRSSTVPPAIEEEAPSPSFDSAPSLPPSNTSTPSTSAASLFSPPGPAAPNPNSPYGQQPSDDPTGRSSTFSLGDGADGSDYDPTDSTNALPTSGFYGVGQNDTMESIAREGLEDWTHRTTTQGAPTLHGSYSAGPTVSTFGARRSASEPMGGAGRNAFLHPPNTISILWSFAHLEGTFEVEESLIKPAEFVEVKRALLGGAGTGMGMGGGTLEENPGGGGWRNWLFGGEQGRGLGASWEERKRYTMKEKTVPTFSSPPSILGIDLVLEPGQTKSCEFPFFFFFLETFVLTPVWRLARRHVQHPCPSGPSSVVSRQGDQVFISPRRRYEPRVRWPVSRERRRASAKSGDASPRSHVQPRWKWVFPTFFEAEDCGIDVVSSQLPVLVLSTTSRTRSCTIATRRRRTTSTIPKSRSEFGDLVRICSLFSGHCSLK